MSAANENEEPTAIMLLPLPMLTGAQALVPVNGLYALACCVEGHYGSVICAFPEDRNTSAAAAYARLFGPPAPASGQSPGPADDEPFSSCRRPFGRRPSRLGAAFGSRRTRHVGGPADRAGSLEPLGWGDVPRRPAGSLAPDPGPLGELLALLALLHRGSLQLDRLVTPPLRCSPSSIYGGGSRR